MKGFPNFIIPHDSLGIAVTMPRYNSQKFGFWQISCFSRISIEWSNLRYRCLRLLAKEW